MRGLKTALIAAVMVAVAAFAAAGDMTLTRHGDLYRIAAADDGLVITATLADDTTAEYLVPGTAGTATSALNLAVDPISNGIFVIWQQDETVQFASLVEDTWSGPMVLAGGDGLHAINPQMVLFRAVDIVEEEGEGEEIVQIEVASTFLHVSWWSYADVIGDGDAFYLPIPVTDDGMADADAYDAVMLSEILPYGIPCEGIDDAAALAAPKLFSDPQSGFPHVFASDFKECLFNIFQIGHDVSIDPETERRRHTIILRHGSAIPVNTDLPLDASMVEVGHGLRLVMYWDGENSVDYVTLDDEGSSDVMSLPIGEGLSHEQAVELVESLAQ